jgi:hypothetical protein
MTDESFPIEYSMTGLRAPATASLKMSMDSDSNVLANVIGTYSTAH